MTIDLSKCKPNQKVVTHEGEIGILVGCSDDPYYPYIVRFTEYNCPRTYTREGYWFVGEPSAPRNIIAILHLDEPLITDSELLEENTQLKARLADWDRTLIASVSDENKNCTSPVGAAQAEIAHLEQEVVMLKAELESVKRHLDLYLGGSVDEIRSYLYKGEEWGVEEIIPSIWRAYDLLILYDGYNVTTGQRIHVVLRGDTSTPKILDNALIVTVEYFNDNFKRFTE